MRRNPRLSSAWGSPVFRPVLTDPISLRAICAAFPVQLTKVVHLRLKTMEKLMATRK